MSACLFTLKPETIQAMSDDDLADAIIHWKQRSQPKKDSRFECDFAVGAIANLIWAELEAYRRKIIPHMGPKDLMARCAREGYGNSPIIQRAMIDGMVYGEGTMIFDKHGRLSYVERK